MDVAEMITDLGDHGFTDTGTLTKVRVLQDAIWEIEGMRPWPFLESSATLNFDGTSGLATDWPTQFRAGLKLQVIGTGVMLHPIRLDELDAAVGTQLAKVAAPRVYYPEGEQLKLWPVPPNGTQVRLRYLKWTPAITSGSPATAIALPARHHRAIVLGALIRLYDMEDDPELAARFQSHYETRLEAMVEDLFRKQYDRPEIVHVEDPDSWDYDW